MQINTGPLSGRRAEVVKAFLENLIAANPGVNGFLLQGSSWSPADQMPEFDVDLNYAGQAAEGPAGDPLREFDHMIDGVRMELISYIWGDLSRPEELPLTSAVSLARAHVLCERDEVFSRPKAVARRLLCEDRPWVRTRIEKAIEGFRLFAAGWSDVKVLEAPIRGDWDFVRCTLLHANGITSCADLRPPSHARKALFDTFTCCATLGIPEFAEQISAAIGMADFSAEEVGAWCDRIEASYDHARQANPDGWYYKARYNVLGARTMVERGCAKGGMWPLWRAARECASSTQGTDAPSAEFCRSCFEDLGNRLAVSRTEDLLKKVALLEPAIQILERSTDTMTDHLMLCARKAF